MKSPNRLGSRSRSGCILKCTMIALLIAALMVTYVPPLVQGAIKPIMIPTDGSAKRSHLWKIGRRRTSRTTVRHQSLSADRNQRPSSTTVITRKSSQLTGDQPLTYENGKVSTSCDKGHYYYQGNLRTRELPWTIIISYRLDDHMYLPKIFPAQTVVWPLSWLYAKIKMLRAASLIITPCRSPFRLIPIAPVLSQRLTISCWRMLVQRNSLHRLCYLGRRRQ